MCVPQRSQSARSPSAVITRCDRSEIGITALFDLRLRILTGGRKQHATDSEGPEVEARVGEA